VSFSLIRMNTLHIHIFVSAKNIIKLILVHSSFLFLRRYVLDNSTDFESKLQRLVNIVSKLVGLPTNLSKRSAKYLLRQRPNTALFPENVDFHIFEVEKVCIPLI